MDFPQKDTKIRATGLQPLLDIYKYYIYICIHIYIYTYIYMHVIYICICSFFLCVCVLVDTTVISQVYFWAYHMWTGWSDDVMSRSI